MQPLEQPRFPVRLAAIFVILSLGIAVSGYLYYEEQRGTIERQRNEDLGAIADLKVSQIEGWRRERIADAEFLHENLAVLQALGGVLASSSPHQDRDVIGWMDTYKKRFGYTNLLLLDASGRLRLSALPEPGRMESENTTLAALAMKTGTAILSDLHRNAANTIHLDLCVPISWPEKAAPLGALLIQIDPFQSLYPLVESWPTPSRTAETLLVRRVGNEVQYLNELRHRKGTALSFRLPIERTVLPVVVPGPHAIGESNDYRGVPVVAATRLVSGSSWILVAKMDREEIYRSLRQRALSTALLGFFLLIAAATSVLLLWREQQVRFYRRQQAATNEQRALLARLDYLSRYANDIILLAEPNGQILDANERAIVSYGYTRDELLELTMTELSCPTARPEFERQWTSIMEQGDAFFETSQQCKDLSTFPVECSGALVSFDGNMSCQMIIRDISERKAAEQQLRLMESAMLQTSDGVVIVEVCGDYPCRPHPVFMNAAFERLTGYSREDLEQEPNLLLTQSRPATELIQQPCAEFGTCPAHMERKAWRKDGSEFVAEWNVTPILGKSRVATHCVWTCRDVTERRRAEESLRYLSSIVESSEDAIIGKNREGIVLAWNKGAERIYGYSAREMVGRPISVLLPPQRRDEFPEIMEYLMHGQSIEHFETERKRKDGRRIFVSLTVSPIKNPEKEIVGASVIARDITGRKEAESEIRTLNQELEHRVIQRTAQLQEANKELEAFAYSVSHDLRAPLRAIDGFSRILLKEYGPQLPAEAQHYLAVACGNAVQMGELIDGLLKFSRLSRQSLCKQPVATADLVRQVWNELRAEKNGRQVEIVVGDLEPCEGDALLLKQVFVNLLSNALKYTRARDIARIEVGNSNPGVYFVRDNGVGFDIRYRDKLFGVFQRLHRAEDYEGTGVGLATVHRIINRHGGRVWADAVLNEGATFYFTLAPGERNGNHAG